MKQLSGLDASFIYLDSRGAHLTLTGLYVYQQPRRPHRPVGYADIVRHVRSRLHAIPVFSQKLVRPPMDLDYPYWVEDGDFELDSHIHFYEGEQPENLAGLYDVVALLHARPLDLSKPPWEMHFIEKTGPLEGLPRNCFALITRYHHAAIDGASGSALVHGLHHLRPKDFDESAIRPGKGKMGSESGTWGLLARAAVNNLLGQVRLLRSFRGAVPGMIRSTLKPDDAEDSGPVPDTRFNRSITADRVFHALTIPLTGIKAIRNAVPGATVNDVVLAICGGGLRNWLESLGELPEDSLVAMVPVNLRPPGEESSSGNQVGMMFVPIHSDIASPLARLRAVCETTRRAKQNAGSENQENIREIVSHIPALAVASAGRALTSLSMGRGLIRLCNCTITNVPSPARTLYLGRARMVYTSGAGPILDGMGLIISLFTYRDRVDFSFTSCPAMLPEPERLGHHTMEAYESLRMAARSAAGD